MIRRRITLMSVLLLGGLYNSYAQEVRDAQFPGGDKALQQFIRTHAIYPSDIKKKNDFKVIAEILIKEDGTAVFGKLKKTKGAKDGVLREVKHLINSMPPWEPAIGRNTEGKTVAEKSVVQLTIPFTHRLYVGENEMVVQVNNAGTLAQQLTQEQQDTCTALTIKGKLNSTDILTLRQMAGADGGKGRLKMLDLTHAEIVTDRTTPYLVIDAFDERIKSKRKEESVDGGMQIPETADYSHLDFKGGPFLNQQMAKVSITSTVFLLDEKATSQGNTAGNWYDQKELNMAKLKEKDMWKFKGHTLTMENGRCIFKAYTTKKTYCRDMFYRCPQLKYVMMPWNHQENDKVRVGNLQHLYLL
ncbi:MAG: hypothetical protein J5661_05510 [Bacteroidaceae bacterium]|nr:hypothetical protein [Bacteroidaceae bacterium]